MSEEDTKPLEHCPGLGDLLGFPIKTYPNIPVGTVILTSEGGIQTVLDLSEENSAYKRALRLACKSLVSLGCPQGRWTQRCAEAPEQDCYDCWTSYLIEEGSVEEPSV